VYKEQNVEKLKRGSKDLSEFRGNSEHSATLKSLMGFVCTVSFPVCRPVTTLICKGEQPTIDQSGFWKEFAQLGVRDDLMQTSVVLTVEGQVVGVFCSTHTKKMPEEFRLAVEEAAVTIQEALLPAAPEVTASPKGKGHIPSSLF
jgi:hypothetical protein